MLTGVTQHETGLLCFHQRVQIWWGGHWAHNQTRLWLIDLYDKKASVSLRLCYILDVDAECNILHISCTTEDLESSFSVLERPINISFPYLFHFESILVVTDLGLSTIVFNQLIYQSSPWIYPVTTCVIKCKPKEAVFIKVVELRWQAMSSNASPNHVEE